MAVTLATAGLLRASVPPWATWPLILTTAILYAAAFGLAAGGRGFLAAFMPLSLAAGALAGAWFPGSGPKPSPVLWWVVINGSLMAAGWIGCRWAGPIGRARQVLRACFWLYLIASPLGTLYLGAGGLRLLGVVGWLATLGLSATWSGAVQRRGAPVNDRDRLIVYTLALNLYLAGTLALEGGGAP
jgi:hypothetical protein